MPEQGLSISNKTTVQPTREQREQAVYTGQLNKVIQNLYSLALWHVGTNSVYRAGQSLDPAGRDANNVAEYNFRTPPKVHEMSEPYATTIVPTQNGGKWVESHGSIIRNIKIQGTTGIRPNKQGPGVIPLLGLDTGDLDVLLGGGLNNVPRTLPQGEATGYDDIIFLRNLFREYSDVKSRDRLSSFVMMIWRNAKDGDYWIVEPVDFRLSQNSSNPLGYEYTIELKALARFEWSFARPEDPMLDILNGVKRITARVQEYSQALKRSFLFVSTQINRLAGLGIFAASTVLKPILNVIQGLNTVINTSKQFDDTITQRVSDLTDNIVEESEKLANKTNEGKLSVQDPIIREFHRIRVTAARIAADPAFRESVGATSVSRRRRFEEAYQQPGISSLSPNRSGNATGSLSFIGNEVDTSIVAQEKVHTGEDIKSAAGRLLGNKARWRTLVVLNDLKSPYISSAGGEGVLQPGDAILYPSTTGEGVDSFSPNESTEEGDLNPVEESYGRDVKLKSTTSSFGTDYTDIVVSQRGDLERVVGIPNVEQAVKVKFSTEQGELPAHPRLGASFPIGSKVVPESLNEYQINTKATLVSDSRVNEVDRINFEFVGDVLVINSRLKLKDSSAALNTKFAVRRL